MAQQDTVSTLVTCLKNEKEAAEHSRALKVYQRAARWIPLAVGPFINIDTALYAGAAKVNHSELPPNSEEDLSNFKMILKICPGLKKALKGFNGDIDLLKCFIGHLATAASNARADDTGSCRKAAIEHVIPTDPEINIRKKSGRGWNNRDTARLLCPLKYISEFDNDPDLFMGKVLDGTIKIKASQWPSFLYPADTVYDRACLDKDLFCGPTVLVFLRNICTGPTSADDGIRKASKPSKAEIHGMDHVFGRCVAYVAVQAYFSLSAIEQWTSSPQEGYFNLEDFFDRCVDLFERDPTDPWVTETLDYLTSELPSITRKYRRKRKRNGPSESGDNSSDEDETKAIHAQREARRLEHTANKASSNNTQEEPGGAGSEPGGAEVAGDAAPPPSAPNTGTITNSSSEPAGGSTSDPLPHTSTAAKTITAPSSPPSAPNTPLRTGTAENAAKAPSLPPQPQPHSAHSPAAPHTSVLPASRMTRAGSRAVAARSKSGHSSDSSELSDDTDTPLPPPPPPPPHGRHAKNGKKKKN